MKDVCLVQMPFSLLFQPSLALSILKCDVESSGLSCGIDYANLRFAHMIGAKHYERVQAPGVLYMTGEAVFSECAGFANGDNFEEYFQGIEGFGREHKKINYFDFNLVKESFFYVKEQVEKFIDETAHYLLSHSPKIIGCSSTFQQNNASFALCKRIKELDSTVITIMGGAQCAADMGVTISEYIPYVDYVFSGEADHSFGELCVKILGGEPWENLPYGTIIKGKSVIHKAPYAITEDMDAVPVPDYSEYFEALKEYGFDKIIQPTLLIEGSRGCWWGEKNPCTFCGLGSVTRKYRQKSVARVLKELNEQSEKYNIKQFLFTDSILSNEHLRELIPQLKQQDRGYSLFCEIKSNLTEGDIKNLREAGFTFIQPGIENLQDDILQLMHKGNTAIRHIELLRNCRTYGMKVSWNILVGFPGEEKKWLKELLDVMPLLSHLQSPNNLNHIIYQKYSVYTNNPEQYGLELEPMKVYDYIYAGNKEFIKGMAYNYEPCGIEDKEDYYDLPHKDEVYQQLTKAYYDWSENFLRKGDRLQMFTYPDKIEILDFRQIAKKTYYTLVGIQKEIYSECRTSQKKVFLLEKYKETFAISEIEEAIKYLIEQQLVISIHEEVLALATENLEFPFEKDKSPFGFIDVNGWRESNE
ncbi:RiPP maturation radical SAM C-methyltransferase [Anaerosporobacter sp.]|uniref:RiPP maturation radical SAM C-methyltransferase n=1 Tax=Anaerosporobacter sp. TaxID=1872529 RepID=UPI00286F4B16|nr:RiPP maturation radical SAM C-methyltransferase [Anaerosporobacter sp.]